MPTDLIPGCPVAEPAASDESRTGLAPPFRAPLGASSDDFEINTPAPRATARAAPRRQAAPAAPGRVNARIVDRAAAR